MRAAPGVEEGAGRDAGAPPRRLPARCLESGPGAASWNMAVDEALLEACRADLASGCPPEEIPITFRVYAWSPPALSLGRSQSAGRDVRLEALAAQEIGLCRRLTGGRAVLHDQEVTYSLTGPEALLGRSVAGTYRRVSLGLAAGLRRLGAPIELVPPGGRAPASRGSCFATASAWELAIGGRKVVGSAQCRAGGAVLQHGSVLLRSPEERLAGLLRSRRGGDGAAPGRAIGLSEALGREVGFGEVARALRAGLEETLPLAFRPEPLSPRERARAEELAARRYADPAWTLAR